MRSAEEICNDIGVDTGSPRHQQAIYKAINLARKEAIQECAKRVNIKEYEGMVVQHDEIDEESILSLINELK